MPIAKLILEYDGTNYAGWQRQPDRPTVQAAVEHAIERIAQIKTAVIGAGRTDSGVHAVGQVASFRLSSDRPELNWTRALNAVLPPDICVRCFGLMPETFHARYSAVGKLYEYRILNRRERPALDRGYVWHIYGPLNLQAMQRAAAILTGRHDFSSFEGALTENENPLCTMKSLTVERRDDRVLIQAYADRFLKQMVRAIVGTLVDVGLGRRTPDSLVDILQAKDRSAAGRTAPAHGLFLMRVDY